MLQPCPTCAEHGPLQRPQLALKRSELAGGELLLYQQALLQLPEQGCHLVQLSLLLLLALEGCLLYLQRCGLDSSL